MVEAIQSQGGIVDNFIGDAIIAVFGMVTSPEEAALRACRAAQRMDKILYSSTGKTGKTGNHPILNCSS